MADTKADLEKQVRSLTTKLGKAEARGAELEAELEASDINAEPELAGRVFGPGAVPLEQR